MRAAGQERQASEAAAAFVQVVDVEQHAGFGMAAFERDESCFAELAERGRKAPDFNLRNDAERIAQLQAAPGSARLPGAD